MIARLYPPECSKRSYPEQTPACFMSSTVNVSCSLPRSWLARTAGFLAFWVILSGLDPVDLLVGAVAAVIATWTSLHLLPPGPWSFRPLALAQLALRFLRQSISAAIDVAWRALDPRMPLRPGFVFYPVRFPPGTARNAFTAPHEPAARHGAGWRRERTTRVPLPRCRPACRSAVGGRGSGAVAGTSQ